MTTVVQLADRRLSGPHIYTSMMLPRLMILALAFLKYDSIDANPIHNANAKPPVATEFIILHNNDMHARFEQTSVSSGICTPEEARSNKCYGGFARVAYEVGKFRDEARRGGTPVFYLNAGDTYAGTAWFSIFKDKIASAFLNKLKPDAISLGNHEFDEQVAGLIPFLNDVEFPVLACNLDMRNVPQLAAAKHLANSTVLETNGTRIGVIGYLTPDTKKLTLNCEADFFEEIVSINAEAKKLKAQGINIIIALGHSGYKKDLEIAKSCPDVDIVIGGHTNTFLYNGTQPDAEKIEGPYPNLIRQKSGKMVPVVQAYAYTKYLGKLHVQFDAEGNLIEFDGSPILLDASVNQTQDVLDLLEVYRANVTALEKSIVGHTRVLLEGRKEICRARECNMGNLITDAMVFSRVLDDLGGVYWTDAAIAVLQGGGIRSSIEKRSDGTITENDLLTLLPWGNLLYVVRVKGHTLRNALEHAAAVRSTDSDGGFLQVSGIHVIFNQNKPKGQRVVSVDVRCAACPVPDYKPLNNSESYNLVISEFLFHGGDGHNFNETDDKITFLPVRLQLNDRGVVGQYLKNRDSVYPEIEGRIKFVQTSAASGLLQSFALLLASLGVMRLFS
ncbi:protein 5NUC-like isoform X1 [Drosophila tropicalis]|uniref:protein 5NUC-like isoform X1 n=2 Tax=Drosophila tropicalis TaxID=46794 RepID=UPI0035AB957C